jgi:hypothetical protein
VVKEIDGTSYEGNFSKGKMDGKGFSTDINGKSEDHVYEHGKLMEK